MFNFWEKSIMKKYGNYKRYEKRHKRFKSDNDREYKKNYTIEYIHERSNRYAE